MPFQKGAYHHSDKIKKKLREDKLGDKNPNWKGNNVKNKHSGNLRAIRMYPCPKSKERHHKDGNPLNNEPENIDIVTRREHMIEDGRLEKLKATQFKPKFRVKKHKGPIYVKSSLCPKPCDPGTIQLRGERPE